MKGPWHYEWPKEQMNESAVLQLVREVKDRSGQLVCIVATFSDGTELKLVKR